MGQPLHIICEQASDHMGLLTNGIAFLALVVAVLVGYHTIQLQIVAAIQSQLTNKAKEANKYIVEKDQRFPMETHNVSAIVSSILHAGYILDLQFSTYKFFLIKRKKQQFIDLFYLELHTSVGEYIQRNQLELVLNDTTLASIIKEQLNDCHNFLKYSNLRFRYASSYPKP